MRELSSKELDGVAGGTWGCLSWLFSWCKPAATCAPKCNPCDPKPSCSPSTPPIN